MTETENKNNKSETETISGEDSDMLTTSYKAGKNTSKGKYL